MAHAMNHPHDMGAMHKEGSMTAAAFIMGAAIGAISGILFAPKAGRETREDIRHKSKEMNDMAHERIDQAKAKTHDTMDKLRSKKDEVMSKAKTARQHADETKDDMDSDADRRAL